MQHNLFKYIIEHSRRDQLFILLIVVLSQPFYYLSLDLPKIIVNRAIQGEGFDDPLATASFLSLQIPLPDFLAWLGTDGVLTVFEGVDFERVPYLVAMSLLFLLLVVINGGFKLYINTAKGKLGERMLRRLRYELFDRILRFPPAQLRKMKQAEVATMIKDEVEPLGGFIGDAFITPAYLGLQGLTALYFILWQSVYLGTVAVGVLLLQAVIIPRLRRRLLVLGKERQLTARQLAGRIAENVDGIVEVHAHDTSNYERADIVARLGRIFGIRFELYQRKFAIKFLNNLLAQVTPFLFYLIGGFLAITGRLDIGQLVAVIAAYKDLPGPVKELIDWDQQRQDVQIKYEQVIDQFTPESMLPPELQAPVEKVEPLSGSVVLTNLTAIDEADGRLLEGINLRFELDEHVAVAGPPGGGRNDLALALARLIAPTSGHITIGGQDLTLLPEAVTGRRIAYVGQDAYLFARNLRDGGTLRDNLLYGLKHVPLRKVEYDEEQRRKRALDVMEAQLSANPEFDIKADWVDYAAAGASGPEDINARLIEMLPLVELEDDVYQFGLRGTIEPGSRPRLVEAVLNARRALRGRLAEKALVNLVEPFDRGRYNKNMSLLENLMFGTPAGDKFEQAELARPAPKARGWWRAETEPAGNAYLRAVVEAQDLAPVLFKIGHQIAETMVELFADLPPGHEFFEQFSFIAADDLPGYRALLGRIGKAGAEAASREDRARLVALTFPYVEARHRLGVIDPGVEAKVLAARRAFAEGLPEALADSIEFYDESRYNAAASLQDNILFGRLVYGQAQAASIIGQAIGEVLDSLDLRPAVLEVGLDFEVGIAGKRLNAAQRQKVGLGRALLKRPDLLIVNEATAVLDAAAQARILAGVLRMRAGRGVVWVVSHRDSAAKFDRVVVLRDAKIVEQGRPDELDPAAE